MVHNPHRADDRRGMARVDCFVRCRVRVVGSDRWDEGFCVSLSGAGMRCVIYRTPKLDAVLDVMLLTPQHTLLTRGRVAVRHGSLRWPSIGLNFEHPSPEVSARVRELVAAQFAMPDWREREGSPRKSGAPL